MGLFNALYIVLKHRFNKSRKRGNKGSILFQVYNKTKHGYPIYSVYKSSEIFIYVKSGDDRIRGRRMTCSDNKAKEFFRSIEAFRNSIQNLTVILTDKGFLKSTK